MEFGVWSVELRSGFAAIEIVACGDGGTDSHANAAALARNDSLKAVVAGGDGGTDSHASDVGHWFGMTA